MVDVLHILKNNPYHDKTGRFTSKDKASGGTSSNSLPSSQGNTGSGGTTSKKHQWNVATYDNGDRTYSLTERCTNCFKTRKVNPNNGRIQKR